MSEVFEDLELIKTQIEKQKLELALKKENDKKSIEDITLSDIKIELDASKNVEEQTEDVVGAMTTATAIKDKTISTTLVNKKAEELVNKAQTKATKAQKAAIDAETELQQAERKLYEAVLNTFGIYKHLPRFLMKLLVYALTPLYVALAFIIGVPCGIIKVLIDNVDGIVCRYEETKDGVKPKMRIIFWILLVVLVVGAICLTVLKCLGKI